MFQESYYQHFLSKHLGGSHLQVETGITDVTTDTIHAEIKKWSDWKNGIKQIMLYNAAEPREVMRLYFFEDYPIEQKNVAIKYILKFNIEIYEFIHQDNNKKVIINPITKLYDIEIIYTEDVKQVEDITEKIENLKIKNYNYISKKSNKKRLYECVCCGYKTSLKTDMRRHLYTAKKNCPKTENIIELTDEIKEHILANRVYHIPIII
jgi:hypothetical protein